MVRANLILGVTLRWTIPIQGGGGSRNTPDQFILQKLDMSAGLIMSVDGQLGYYTDVALSVTSYNKRTEGTLQNDTAQQTLK